jgi:magnesium chelatase subunit I
VAGEPDAVARLVDLETAVEVLSGKIEFESGEEGREADILTHLLRTAIAETVRKSFRGLDFALLIDAIEDGRMVTTGTKVAAGDFLAGLPVLGESDLYDQIGDRVYESTGGPKNDGQLASAIELALEGLFLARKIGKDTADGETIYG